MKKLVLAAFLFVPIMLAGNALAQEQDAETLYVYATYFVCSPDGESRADEIINSSFKPHYDAAVEQGDILSWSWMQHFVGGQWRRVLVIITPDMDSLIDASGALGEIVSENTPEAGRAFSAICSSHEDYVWQTVDGISGSSASDQRGDAGFSVYFRCDISREERADELVAETLAPVYDRHVAEGELTSWSWLQHNIGGEWRRLLIMGAADHKAIVRARAAIIEELQERRAKRAVDELNSICHSHTDYMWDILIQTP